MENREDPNSGISGAEEFIPGEGPNSSAGETEGPVPEEDPNLSGSGVEGLIPDLNYRIIQLNRPSPLSKQSEQIVANNCGGTTAVVQVFEIARTVEIKVIFELSTKIIKGFEEIDFLIADAISNELGLMLGIERAGCETTFTSSVAIITEPGTITIATVEWRETWTRGEVEITCLDGGLVDILPFSYLNSIFLEPRGVETIECDSNTDIVVTHQSMDSNTPGSLSIVDITNNKNFLFSFPSSTNPPRKNFCEICGDAYIETGNEEVYYQLFVPEGWVVIIDSWQAYWSGDNYLNDGILIICGEWEGDVHINSGSLCGVPIRWKEEVIIDRRAATNNDGRPEYTICSPSQ